ncbi:hypothetical protein TNCV_368861 [Trichonephila clavipes]|nr:hypothetical protein TNCV_368861 [Trichonephila clavipes]
MRARAYYAHPSICDLWALRCSSRCPDQAICLNRDKRLSQPYTQTGNGTRTCGVEARYAINRPQGLLALISTTVNIPEYIALKSNMRGMQDRPPEGTRVNLSQVMRTKLGTSTPSSNFHFTPTGGRLSLDRFNVQQPSIHGKFSAVLGSKSYHASYIDDVSVQFLLLNSENLRESPH